jgi:hypothetical protein
MMTETPENETTGTAGTAEGAAGTSAKAERTWTEEVEVAGSQLVERVKTLIAEGNVRRLILRNASGGTLIEIPLTAGVAVGGVFAMFYPVLAAVGALAALVANVKIDIVRVDNK